MPTQQPPPAWGTAPSWAKGWSWGKDVKNRNPNLADMTQLIANQMLGYVDPTTQAEVGSWLYRQQPERWRSYRKQEGAALPPPPPSQGGGQQYLDANRLREAAASLNFRQLAKGFKGGLFNPGQLGIGGHSTAEKARELEEKFGGGVGWLRDFLNTAAGAYGTGVNRASRAEQAFAGKRLAQLAQEAQTSKKAAPFAGLAEKIVNPVLAGAIPGGGLGQQRATSGPGPDEYRRAGQVARNPWAT